MNALTIISILLTVCGALYALSARHLMRGVLGLSLFFLGIAGFFGELNAWYLAAGQLFLFLGGVVTLFVLAFNFEKTPEQTGAKVKGLFFAAAVGIVLSLFFPVLQKVGLHISAAELGRFFFTTYGIVFNIGILVLFSAFIGTRYFLEVEK